MTDIVNRYYPMIRTLALIALTAPANASTLSYTSDNMNLNTGDMGIVWVDGEGFRPIDGIDMPMLKFDCPRVGWTWKDGRGDFVDHATSCDQARGVMASSDWIPSEVLERTADGGIYTTVQPAGSFTRTAYHQPVGHPLSPPHTPKTPIWHDTPPTYHPPGPPADEPHMPPVVPLPASVWMMLAALGCLRIWRKT